MNFPYSQSLQSGAAHFNIGQILTVLVVFFSPNLIFLVVVVFFVVVFKDFAKVSSKRIWLQ